MFSGIAYPGQCLNSDATPCTSNPERRTRMELEQFFKEEKIDLFSEVSLDDLSGNDRSSVLEFLPAARSVIVLGKEVPVAVYAMDAKEKTRAMYRIAELLDATARSLAGHLNAAQFPSLPVPLLFPVRIVDDRVQGLVRLKQIAATAGLGSIGKNTLLLTHQFGPRVVLSGVVTARPAQNSGGFKKPESQLCTGCERCIRACPEHAIGLDGVDAFRCRAVSAWVPEFLIPAAKWMLRRTLLLRIVAPLVPWIARNTTMPCSLCVTECPGFAGDEGKGKVSGYRQKF